MRDPSGEGFCPSLILLRLLIIRKGSIGHNQSEDRKHHFEPNRDADFQNFMSSFHIKYNVVQFIRKCFKKKV